MFQLGELHGKALGTAFQKEHSSQQRRFSFVCSLGSAYSDRLGARRAEMRQRWLGTMRVRG
jgi:hypothetical protein